MTNRDNTNTGIVAKNDRKTQDNHPDITGSINVNGVEYWLNGWQKKRNSDGRPFYSLSVKPKDQQASGQSRPAPRQEEAMDDEIPF
jgi:hypothetical protein